MALKYNSDKFDSCLNTYRDKMSFALGIGSTDPDQNNEASTMMPLDFSLEMDGISGIIPNSAFEIPANTLPNSYLTKIGNKPKIAFILHTIDHNFNNNKWTTKITGQTLNIRFDSLSPEEKAARKAAKEQEVRDIEASIRATSPNFIIPKGCTRQSINLLSNPQVVINLKLISNALKKLGLTNTNAIASILAISGGESGLIPQSEGHAYKLNNLNSTFPGLTEDQAKRATKPGISKIDFFTIVYGEYSPSRVGNRGKNDGGLYYGRGFNQLTGYTNYVNTNNFLKSKFGVNEDIVRNPDKMNDPNIASKAVALFYLDKMKGVSQSDPNYFRIALTRTGHDANGGYQKKAEYFSCLTSDYKWLI